MLRTVNNSLQNYIHFFHRYSVQDKVLRNRNENDLQQAALRAAVAQKLAVAAAVATNNANNTQDSYDRNQNKYIRQHSSPQQLQHNHQNAHQQNNGNSGGHFSPQHLHLLHLQHQQQQQQQLQYHQNNANNVNNGNGGVQRERYQHPALAAIINESQGMKFRGECEYINN